VLVLTRKEGEAICVGEDITITISKIKGNRVSVGIAAPEQVRIRRTELPHLPEVAKSAEAILPSV
jgi:carbon storage regulator